MEGQKIYFYANYLSSKGIPFYLYDNWFWRKIAMKIAHFEFGLHWGNTGLLLVVLIFGYKK